MEIGFNHIEDYYSKYTPGYGTYSLDFDPLMFIDEAYTTFNSPDAKRSGRNDFNRFNNTSKETKQFLSEYWNSELNLDYDWNWEYFHSGEPAGLHTDYTSFPNSWRPNKEYITHDCHLVLGVIIPLEWNCKQPYTVMYDRVTTEPRKMIYRRGEMRYMDTDEVVAYREQYSYDPEVEVYNPKGTQYHGEYADLKFHSAYAWSVGTCVAFDTRRWHSSSWFLDTSTLLEVSTAYKRSIIGFASIDVDR
tara:strand:+ start:445 stop:1185 length:741 start_codon:yes stop_codon:yes gene_type:complete